MTGPRIGLPPGRCRVGIAAAAACLLVATPEPGTATSAQVPQFRSGIDLVQLDVSVLDRSGQPVRGLTAEGFTVFEDGVPQRIQAFSEIVVPVPAPQSSPWSARVSPDVATNAAIDDHRLFVIVMDDATMPVEPSFVQTAKDIASDIVRRLGSGDLAAVVFTRGSRYAQDFTAETGRLLAAIDTFSFI